ncbi:SurA N-terminal domain-containing protein [Sutcliffiella horikoshii]|uniref:SurA N-terminal domain-containing protein n=1 Tax=Sutcliffiella horikoshii TaxID=79883 RepID=UPI0007D0AE42|nr:SurA N-terminal domain-containing protein [Sutcliffiella horikoshii]MCM3616321.1 SurA N-terminal domain-containing protein [Sutcliffiella horikoshii]
MKKKLTIFLVSMLTAVLLAACGSNGNNAANEGNGNKEAEQGQEQQTPEVEEVDPEKVVAKVNGQEIKGQEYNNMLQQTQMMMMQFGQGGDAEAMKDQTLNTLIDQEILSQEVSDKGYEASEKEIEDYINEIKEGYESEEKFEEALEASPLTMDTLKAQISEELALQKYMEKEFPETKVSDEQVKEYYDQAKQQSEAQQAEAPEGEEAPQNEFPEFAEVEDQIRGQLEQEEVQQKLQALVEDLKKDSEIEKLI